MSRPRHHSRRPPAPTPCPSDRWQSVDAEHHLDARHHAVDNRLNRAALKPIRKAKIRMAICVGLIAVSTWIDSALTETNATVVET
jgi:hypothetical protein